MISAEKTPEKSFHDAVHDRYSVRAFSSDPLTPSLLQRVLTDAQQAPSNCNTQPWQVHIVSGQKRNELSQALLRADTNADFSSDFSFAIEDYSGLTLQRAKEQGAEYYKSLGIPRDALNDRRTVARKNLTFFGAPHVALLFMHNVGDNVRVAGDIGMYAQTFLLSLSAHGLGGIPQTMLGLYANTIRNTLGIDRSCKLLFGISFGHPCAEHAPPVYRTPRAKIGDQITWHK